MSDDLAVPGDHLTVLLADYAEARDDERSFTNSTGVAFGLLLAVLGGLAAFASSDTGLAVARNPDFDLFKVIVPAAPLAIIIYLQLQATTTIVRSYYMRSLEAEIAALDGAQGAHDSLAASYVQVLLSITSLRRGNWRYRLLALIVLVILVVIFGGMVVYLAFTVRWPYAIAIAILYVPPVVLLACENYSVTIRGNRMWSEITADRPHFPIPGFRPYRSAAQAGRSLISYLLLPRLEELVKLSFVAVGFIVGSIFLSTVSGRTLVGAVLGVVVFEYLVYEARYQWNDLRGIPGDRTHPEAAQRGRLPIGNGTTDLLRAVKASILVASLRMVVAATVCVVLIASGAWTQTGWLLLTTSTGAVLVAVVYERLRALGTHPHAVWGVVGGGYALRLMLGMLLPVSALDQLSAAWVAPAVLAAAAGWAVGSTSILMTWALEASAALVVPDDRVVGPEPAPGTAASDRRPQRDLLGLVPFAPPGVALVLTASSSREHIKQLAPHTQLLMGISPEVWSTTPPGHRPAGAFAAIQGSPRDTPWNRRAIIAAGTTAALGVWAAASWTGIGVPPVTNPLQSSWLVAVGLMAAVGAWWVAGLAGVITRWAGWIASTVALALLTVLATQRGSPSSHEVAVRAAFGIIPFCYFHVANYTLFRDVSYHGLKHPFRPVVEAVRGARAKLRDALANRLLGPDLGAEVLALSSRSQPRAAGRRQDGSAQHGVRRLEDAE